MKIEGSLEVKTLDNAPAIENVETAQGIAVEVDDSDDNFSASFTIIASGDRTHGSLRGSAVSEGIDVFSFPEFKTKDGEFDVFCKHTYGAQHLNLYMRPFKYLEDQDFGIYEGKQLLAQLGISYAMGFTSNKRLIGHDLEHATMEYATFMSLGVEDVEYEWEIPSTKIADFIRSSPDQVISAFKKRPRLPRG